MERFLANFKLYFQGKTVILANTDRKQGSAMSNATQIKQRTKELLLCAIFLFLRFLLHAILRKGPDSLRTGQFLASILPHSLGELF